jgi:hypothetical protein
VRNLVWTVIKLFRLSFAAADGNDWTAIAQATPVFAA